MDKGEIREKILEMRRSLTSKYMEDASDVIFEQMTGMERIRQAANILIYSNFDNEIKTAKLTGWLLFEGKQVYLPTVEGKNMHAVNIRSTVLERSRFGVAQPKLEGSEIAPPEAIDLVVVPGIAFDREKNRIGYGFGYYDSYLKQAKNAFRMAIAYDFQVVEHQIPSTDYDEKMDLILTPDFSVE